MKLNEIGENVFKSEGADHKLAFRAHKTPIEEGRGADLMSYVEYAEATFTNKDRQLFDKLAHELFQRGFSFSYNPESSRSGRFVKRDNEKKVTVAILWNSNKKPLAAFNAVIVSIGSYENGWEPKFNQSYHIEDMVDAGADLDYILRGERNADS